MAKGVIKEKNPENAQSIDKNASSLSKAGIDADKLKAANVDISNLGRFGSFDKKEQEAIVKEYEKIINVLSELKISNKFNRDFKHTFKGLKYFSSLNGKTVVSKSKEKEAQFDRSSISYLMALAQTDGVFNISFSQMTQLLVPERAKEFLDICQNNVALAQGLTGLSKVAKYLEVHDVTRAVAAFIYYGLDEAGIDGINVLKTYFKVPVPSALEKEVSKLLNIMEQTGMEMPASSFTSYSNDASKLTQSVYDGWTGNETSIADHIVDNIEPAFAGAGASNKGISLSADAIAGIGLQSDIEKILKDAEENGSDDYKRMRASAIQRRTDAENKRKTVNEGLKTEAEVVLEKVTESVGGDKRVVENFHSEEASVIGTIARQSVDKTLAEIIAKLDEERAENGILLSDLGKRKDAIEADLQDVESQIQDVENRMAEAVQELDKAKAENAPAEKITELSDLIDGLTNQKSLLAIRKSSLETEKTEVEQTRKNLQEVQKQNFRTKLAINRELGSDERGTYTFVDGRRVYDDKKAQSREQRDIKKKIEDLSATITRQQTQLDEMIRDGIEKKGQFTQEDLGKK